MRALWHLTGGFPMRCVEHLPNSFTGMDLYEDRLGRLWWAEGRFDLDRISAEAE